jgi:hypothetical protein
MVPGDSLGILPNSLIPNRVEKACKIENGLAYYIRASILGKKFITLFPDKNCLVLLHSVDVSLSGGKKLIKIKVFTKLKVTLWRGLLRRVR